MKIKNLQMDKRIIIAAGLILLILAAGYGIHKTKLVKEITNSSEQLINAICTGEHSEYAQFTAGDILYKLHNFKNYTPVEIVDTNIYVREYNNNYAKIDYQVDLKLADGSYDVSWYNMELVNKNGWKVYSIQPCSPFFTGYGFTKDSDAELCRYVLVQYTRQYNNAGTISKFTAGTFRQSLELNKNEPLNEIKGASLQYLYGDNQLVKYDIKYSIEGRSVENIITFYKTQEGWKIVDAQSSFVK